MEPILEPVVEEPLLPENPMHIMFTGLDGTVHVAAVLGAARWTFDMAVQRLVPEGRAAVQVALVDIPQDRAELVDFALSLGLPAVVEATNLARDLAPSEFRGLLAAEEDLGEIYDGMRVALKGAPGSTAKKQRFMLDANRSKKSYSLAATLLMVASFRTFAYSLYPPEDLDRITLALSDDVVTAAWMEAVQMGDDMRARV